MNKARLFRSYKVFDVGTYQEEMKVWQAGRATSAAPTFFKRLKMGDKNAEEQFLDGGLGSNNPSMKLLEEMVEIYGDRDISCIVSIGAGMANIIEYKEPGFFGKVMPTDLAVALKDMVTDCEDTAKAMSKKFLKRPGVYFRFNVEHGLENVGLEEWKELGNITEKTNAYLLDHELDLVVKDAVSQLHAPTAKLKACDLSN
jgi:predicted acylesterase/phospholipase RssA